MRLKYVLVSILLILAVAVTVLARFELFFLKKDANTEKLGSNVSASNTTSGISSKADWDLGSLSNIDSSSSSGSIQMDSESSAKWDLSGKTLTASPDSNKALAIDGSLSTAWNGSDLADYWTIDLGSTQMISAKYWAAETGATLEAMQYSTNGTDWTSTTSSSFGGDYTPCNENSWYKTTAINARYFKLSFTESWPHGLCEFEIYEGNTATHTSAASQITNTNLYQWQTFTPTYTQPANTTVSFRLRTSTDANTWTSWTAYQTPNSGSSLDITSLVTSKTGDAGSETFYKYIQVETKLTSSDGVSTPTVDSYSIGYHTNVVPDKPVGATVTMGS